MLGNMADLRERFLRPRSEGEPAALLVDRKHGSEFPTNGHTLIVDAVGQEGTDAMSAFIGIWFGSACRRAPTIPAT